MSNPTERTAPPHSAALDAFLAGHQVPDPVPAQPEPETAQPPAALVAEPTLPARSHLALIPTAAAPTAAAVFRAAPGDRRAQLRQRAAERNRRRRALSA